MMKKNFVVKICNLILALALVVSLAVVAGCGAHEHTFSTDWKSDASNHWHEAACEHKDEVDGKAAHTFSGDECTVCGYKRAHVHTYAESWTYDETNHWHAATCSHTEEKSATAAHTLENGECTVCHYKQAAKCKCETPCIICPECGGCIDEYGCEREDCEKCGHELKDNYFEAEEAVLKDGITETHFSWTEWIDDFYAEQYADNPIGYVQGSMGNTQGTITFKITSDKACTATFMVRNAKNSEETVFTDNVMVTINGDIIERGSTVPQHGWWMGGHRKRDFDWTNLGCINLQEGENEIVLMIASMDTERGYNFDKIDIKTPQGVTLSWEPTDNSDLLIVY